VSPREAHYYYNHLWLEAVRSGPWKLAVRPQGDIFGKKEGGVKTPGLRLYNLSTDIGERTNVAAQFPDVVAKLKALAAHEAATLCDGSKDGPGVRPPGRVAKPSPLYPMVSGKKGKSNDDEAH